MSNYVNTFAIPWADAVCNEFESRTGQKLMFEPPSPEILGKTNFTKFHYHTPDWDFEATELSPDALILKRSDPTAFIIDDLVKKWERQNKSS